MADPDFPDPEEEFELMYAAEMEMLNEMDNMDYDDFDEISYTKSKAKRSLDFKSCETNTSKDTKNCQEAENLLNNSFVSQNSHEESLSKKKKDSASHRSATEIGNSQDPVNTETLVEALNENTGAAKRRVADLFGDINDIDFDEEHTSKKSKNNELTEEERQLLTIQAIIEERKRLQESKILPRLTNSNLRTSKSKKVTLSQTVPRWNFMALTDKKGERIYARLHSEEEYEKEVKEITNQNLKGGLLPVPLEELKKLAHEQLQKKWDNIEKIQREEQNRTEVEIIREQEKELWVEKYKPKSYLELLSDESTNRALLQWLKLWDKVVFGIERKVKAKHKEDIKGKGGRFQKKTGPVVSEELDEHGRPFHKIALLCGPPGLGKTTLAHMIAHQAGYNVVEVNASDDRSPEIFRTQLEAATQMKAVMGSERRPNCLVLDEIDGAPAASIDVLLKFALGKGTGRAKGAKSKKALGAAEKTDILKRPIICICNDVYVPALRSLRQVAFVVHFPPTSTSRLAQRLCEITKQQSLKTDLGTMMALSEKTNNDIRACLALLQCLKTQSGSNGTVKLSQIHAATLGEKDMQKGLFTVWQEIFQIPRPKRKTFVDTVRRETPRSAVDLESETKTSTSSLAERVSSLLKTVQGCGDYDRLAQGVFENYLNMKIKDSSMVSIASGLTWFCMFDLISTRIHAMQNYILYPYLSYPFVMWHLLFASLSWPKLTYPSTGYEMTMRQQKNTQLVDEVLKSMFPGVRAYTYREQLVQDTLPLLLEIIVPNLRPVSLTLYNSKEKAELQHVIGVMIDYNLTYTQERTPDGSFVFNLDPNVEEVCRFDGGKGCRALNYALRQLVSREIELEKLRRAEASLYRDKPTNDKEATSTNIPKKNTAKEISTPKAEKKALPNHMQRLTPKAVKKPEDLQTKDFFGRVVENSLVPNQLKARTDEIVKSDIWYHFKEGFNNAVRRNVTMADLY